MITLNLWNAKLPEYFISSNEAREIGNGNKHLNASFLQFVSLWACILKLCFKVFVLQLKVSVLTQKRRILLFERRNLLREQSGLLIKKVNHIFGESCCRCNADSLFESVRSIHK